MLHIKDRRSTVIHDEEKSHNILAHTCLQEENTQVKRIERIV